VVSVVPSSRTTIESLINTADAELYHAKESGRNQFRAATIDHESMQEAI
jgi:PleD family two-component response regulator